MRHKISDQMRKRAAEVREKLCKQLGPDAGAMFEEILVWRTAEAVRSFDPDLIGRLTDLPWGRVLQMLSEREQIERELEEDPVLIAIRKRNRRSQKTKARS